MAKSSLLLVLVLLAAAINMASAAPQFPPRPPSPPSAPGHTVEHLTMNILSLTPWAWGGILVVHCKSDDNDYGVHPVEPGQWYNFDFSTNLDGTKYITCSFASGDGAHNQNFITFQDVGRFGTQPRPCSNCVWQVKEDGFYRSENLGKEPAVKIYNWK